MTQQEQEHNFVTVRPPPWKRGLAPLNNKGRDWGGLRRRTKERMWVGDRGWQRAGRKAGKQYRWRFGWRTDIREEENIQNPGWRWWREEPGWRQEEPGQTRWREETGGTWSRRSQAGPRQDPGHSQEGNPRWRNGCRFKGGDRRRRSRW